MSPGVKSSFIHVICCQNYCKFKRHNFLYKYILCIISVWYYEFCLWLVKLFLNVYTMICCHERIVIWCIISWWSSSFLLIFLTSQVDMSTYFDHLTIGLTWQVNILVWQVGIIIYYWLTCKMMMQAFQKVVLACQFFMWTY